MAGGCSCSSNGETLIFTCAGAAHSGQVSNRVGVSLAQEGIGNLFCIAAVAAGIPDKLERARKAAKRLVIDGCEDHCARKIMEKAGLTVDLHVDATQLGIEKKPAAPSLINDSKRVAVHVRKVLSPA